jgi:hypothetical protein
MTRHVLITGSPGSGKSFLCEIFKENGLPALDADTIPEFTGWYDYSGNAAQYKSGSPLSWYDDHRFCWNERMLKKVLAENETVYIFGCGDNVFELSHYFDRRYFLKVPLEELKRRVLSPLRGHPFGKDKNDIDVIESGFPYLEADAKRNKFIDIDGTKSRGEIMNFILSDK